MKTINHEDAELLLAAYALDALASDDERVALERHLAGCASCRGRLDSYREAEAHLAPEVAPPPQLWDRLADHLRPRAVATRSAPVAAPPRRWVVAAAAAVALLVGLGVGRLTGNRPDPSLGDLAAAARAEDGTTVLSLVTPAGRPAADAVVTPEGVGYLTDDALPALPADRSYQLWALREGQPVSVALLGNDPDVEAFRAPSRYEQLLITEEPAVGSPSPTTTPVASATA